MKISFKHLMGAAFCAVSLQLFAQAPATSVPAGLNTNAAREIAALLQEKAGRTPAQQKMESQLVHALKKNRGEPFAPGAPNVRTDVKIEPDGRVLVDINATVTPALLSLIQAGGGRVINSFPQYKAIRALAKLTQLETLAASTNVIYIRRANEAMTHKVDSEGDTTHRAIEARNTFGATGAGVNVGVLSDSVDFYTNLLNAGELPTVTVLPGQSGITNTGEGTAMLEIVHDLAPGAKLYFATGNGGEAQYAYNILNLWTNGCNIINDDLDYDEPPFQDGIVAQAVNTVTANNVLYFSAAMNAGNFDDGTSCTWEGDFADGGAATEETGRLHTFGSVTYDTVQNGGATNSVSMWWADPLGESDNDYDLFLLDPTGATVISSSTGVQNGGQDPHESTGGATNGCRIVIVKHASAAARFLRIHLNTDGSGQISIGTPGATCGHPAAANGYGVAAVDQHSAYPNAFTGGTNNPFESNFSDGLRRIFFNADGSAITPGNFSSSGGTVRQKPDIAAADGVSTDVPNFKPFYGTSAATPHAAAIAALVWSYAPGLTPAQIRTVLTSTALDVNPIGVDRDTGYGIVMAYPALLVLSLSPPNNVWVDFNYSGTQSGTYVNPYSTIAKGISAVASGGDIWIRSPGTSDETPTINKPLTIKAYAGAASIGN
jgi:hypothetical protein